MHLANNAPQGEGRSFMRYLFLVCSILVFALACPVLAQHVNVNQLYSFGGSAGANPLYGALVQGQDGLLYGTTVYGGDHNMGVVFKIDTSGNITTLHSFNGSDGSFPWGGLTLGPDGNFYGGTPNGGAGSFGVIFKISSTGEYTVLHNFLYPPNGGAGPYSPPMLAADGSFYGVAWSGGTLGGGVIYRITSSGQFNVIYNYGDPVGALPFFSPVQGVNGNLYVTTLEGGTNACGSLTEVSTRGILVNQFGMDCAADGEFPIGGLTAGADGDLYGVADQKGEAFCLK